MTDTVCHPKTIGQLLSDGQTALVAGGADSATAKSESTILLSCVTGRSREQILAWPETGVAAADHRRFIGLLDRRVRGEPIAYLTGRREFWSLVLEVGPGVLVPRPETETLVEQALDRLPPTRGARVLDLGTGSGAIALAIAGERPACMVTGTDISTEALAYAMRNQRLNDIGNVVWRQGKWYDAVAGQRFDLIASNPPYVATGDPHLGEGDLPFEPTDALSSGVDGLDAIREIIDGARSHLNPRGFLLLEHGYEQQSPVTGLLEQAGFGSICKYRDLSGQPRVCAARLTGN